MFNQLDAVYRIACKEVLVSLCLVSLASASLAQSVPADLLDLSIEELFASEVLDNQSNENKHSGNASHSWHLQYRYQKSKFKGYGDGTKKLSHDDVLFSPGEEMRTADNYPVVPTTIFQEVHAFVVAYDVSEQMALSFAVPYIKQSTDHISIVPGYSAFNIESSGIGDISVIASRRVDLDAAGNVQFSLGLSFPTGSIDEKGDTPRAPGEQQLPYSMQLGSGTYDIPVSAAYTSIGDGFDWGGEITGKMRFGENDRDYRLGDRVTVSSWLRCNTLQWVKPSVTLSYEYTERIHGMDLDLRVPSAFPYPAPVTNPGLYGGRRANLTIGFRFPVSRAGKYIDLDIGKPIYQSLNGPQTRADIHIGFKYNLNF